MGGGGERESFRRALVPIPKIQGVHSSNSWSLGANWFAHGWVVWFGHEPPITHGGIGLVIRNVMAILPSGE